MSNQVNLNIDELKGFVKHIVNNNRFLQAHGKNPVSIEVIGESGIGKTSSILQLGEELGLNIVKLNLAQIEELGDLVGFPIRQFQLCKQGVSTGSKTSFVETYEERLVKTTVPREVVSKVLKMVEEFETKVTKKQVFKDGKFVTEEVETKIPKMVEKEVEEITTVMEEVETLEKVPVTKEVVESTGDYECLWVDEHAVDEYIKRGYEFTGNKQMAYCPPQWIADTAGGGILILDDYNRADVRFLQACMELK